MTEDKLELLSKRLKEVSDKFKDLKNCGIDEEILIIYLKDKTKLPKKEIKKFLSSLDDFYSKLIKNNILEEIEDEKAQQLQHKLLENL